KDLQIEMIDRFGMLPEPSKNLLAVTKLKLLAEKIGVDKISIYDDKVQLIFDAKTTVSPEKIINLVQTQSQIYRIQGQNQLIISRKMPEDIERINWVGEFLARLEAK
ncbi:MAG: transcription-repair coupling factor, partial [Candidatus Thioglobus sp.]